MEHSVVCRLVCIVVLMVVVVVVTEVVVVLVVALEDLVVDYHLHLAHPYLH